MPNISQNMLQIFGDEERVRMAWSFVLEFMPKLLPPNILYKNDDENITIDEVLARGYYEFNTKHVPPLCFIKYASDNYSDLEFKFHYWHDGDFGDGFFIIRNGNLIKVEYYDNPYNSDLSFRSEWIKEIFEISNIEDDDLLEFMGIVFKGI